MEEKTNLLARGSKKEGFHDTREKGKRRVYPGVPSPRRKEA